MLGDESRRQIGTHSFDLEQAICRQILHQGSHTLVEIALEAPNVGSRSYPGIPTIRNAPAGRDQQIGLLQCQALSRISSGTRSPTEFTISELNRIITTHVDDTEIDSNHSKCARAFHLRAIAIVHPDADMSINPADTLLKHNLDIAILLDQEANRLTLLSHEYTPTQRSDILTSLVINLRRRFRHSTSPPDIEEAINCAKKNVDLFQNQSERRAGCLRLLAKCLRSHVRQIVPGGILDSSMSLKHPSYWARELEKDANEILPLPRLHVDPSLKPDFEEETTEPKNFRCKTINAIRLLLSTCPTNCSSRVQALVAEHSNHTTESPKSHTFCGVELDAIADELRDILEEDGSPDYPDPTAIILIEKEAHRTSRLVQYGQAQAAYQLASSLHRIYGTGWACDSDLDCATIYAYQALQLGHKPKEIFCILSSVYSYKFRDSGLESDFDKRDRFECEYNCEHSAQKRRLRCDAPPSFTCPLASNSIEPDSRIPDRDELITLLSTHSANRTHCTQVPAQCTKLFLRVLGHLDITDGRLVRLVISECLSSISSTFMGRVELLKTCAMVLCLRSVHFKSRTELDEAIYHCSEALGLYKTRQSEWLMGYPPHHLLARLYLLRFNSYSSALADLENSIRLAQIYLESLGNREIHGATLEPQVTLSTALRVKFSVGGNMQDLDASIGLARMAYSSQFLQTKGPGFRSEAGEQLFLGLLKRGAYTGELDDLLEVVSLTKTALRADPSSSSALYACARALSNIPNHLISRSDMDDLIQRLTDHSDDHSVSIDLIEMLVFRSYKNSTCSDLDASISLLSKNPLDLTNSSQSKAKNVRQLMLYVRLLLERRKLGEQFQPDVNLALELLDDYMASSLAPKPQSMLVMNVYILYSEVCYYLFLLGDANKFMHAIQVIQWVDKAFQCSTAAPGFRTSQKRELLYASLFRALVAGNMRMDSAVRFYQFAIEYMRDMIYFQQNIQMRIETLKQLAAGVTGDAATCAILSESPEKAIELLELGRNIFWQQALRLRVDTGNLQTSHPDLVRELTQVQAELESSGYLELVERNELVANQQIQADLASQTRRQLANRYEALIAIVRKIPGFEGYMRPKSFVELCDVLDLDEGVIIVLTLSRTYDRCDALIIHSGGKIDPFHLKCTSPSKILTLSKKHLQYISDARKSPRSPQECNRRPVQGTDFAGPSLEDILRILWVDVVHPILDHIGIPHHRSKFQRIRWLATDGFATLPLHAAGVYSGSNPVCLSDYVISSYLQTISSLSSSFSDIRSQTTITKPKVLVVSQPATPGYTPIPATTLEMEQIQATAPGVVTSLDHTGTKATVKEFLEALPSANIVHVACHGSQSFSDPTKSAIMLYDDPVPISRIMRTPLPNARIAFLSACETAMGDESLQDEALHLGADFIFAGFRSVIGTMWSIQDKDGPAIVKSFYESLSSQSKLENVRNLDSSRALNDAVIQLRKSGADFIRWVPFVHIGQ